MYGFLLVCDSYVQSFTITLHCLQPTALFLFCWKCQADSMLLSI